VLKTSIFYDTILITIMIKGGCKWPHISVKSVDSKRNPGVSRESVRNVMQGEVLKKKKNRCEY